MPYQVGWQLENRIGNLTVLGEFPIEEIRSFASQFITEYLEVGRAPVHLIADLSKMHRHPTRISELREVTAPFLQHPNMGWLVIAGSTPLVSYLATIVTHITHTRYRSALSVDDALKSLKRVDISLE